MVEVFVEELVFVEVSVVVVAVVEVVLVVVLLGVSVTTSIGVLSISTGVVSSFEQVMKNKKLINNNEGKRTFFLFERLIAY